MLNVWQGFEYNRKDICVFAAFAFGYFKVTHWQNFDSVNTTSITIFNLKNFSESTSRFDKSRTTNMCQRTWNQSYGTH